MHDDFIKLPRASHNLQSKQKSISINPTQREYVEWQATPFDKYIDILNVT